MNSGVMKRQCYIPWYTVRRKPEMSWIIWWRTAELNNELFTDDVRDDHYVDHLCGASVFVTFSMDLSVSLFCLFSLSFSQIHSSINHLNLYLCLLSFCFGRSPSLFLCRFYLHLEILQAGDGVVVFFSGSLCVSILEKRVSFLVDLWHSGQLLLICHCPRLQSKGAWGQNLRHAQYNMVLCVDIYRACGIFHKVLIPLSAYSHTFTKL